MRLAYVNLKGLEDMCGSEEWTPHTQVDSQVGNHRRRGISPESARKELREIHHPPSQKTFLIYAHFWREERKREREIFIVWFIPCLDFKTVGKPLPAVACFYFAGVLLIFFGVSNGFFQPRSLVEVNITWVIQFYVPFVSRNDIWAKN